MHGLWPINDFRAAVAAPPTRTLTLTPMQMPTPATAVTTMSRVDIVEHATR
jgi:hypothetical protein